MSLSGDIVSLRIRYESVTQSTRGLNANNSALADLRVISVCVVLVTSLLNI